MRGVLQSGISSSKTDSLRCPEGYTICSFPHVSREGEEQLLVDHIELISLAMLGSALQISPETNSEWLLLLGKDETWPT